MRVKLSWIVDIMKRDDDKIIIVMIRGQHLHFLKIVMICSNI